jgi:hypothetical protein
VSQALLSLAPSELRMLAGAIRMGRLAAPYSALAIKELLGNDAAESIASTLRELVALGMPSAGLAESLELLATSIAQRPKIEDLLDLVVTGPQIGGVANRDTCVVVSELFSKAEHSVVVIGYAVYQGQKVFHTLASRMKERPELQARMYLDIARKAGDTTIEAELVQRFCHTFRKTQWPPEIRLPEIYYDPRSAALESKNAAALHAKCVVVDERDVFVSSANFTEAGQVRNIELGLLLKSEILAKRIVGFFAQYIEARHLMRAC